MNVFIGCGSSNIKEINAIYTEEAIKIASFLAEKGYNLFCGGIDGLQGIVHDTFLKNGKKVTITWVNNYWERHDIPNSLYVNSISERKTTILENTDLMIVLPGAIGTYDEIFNAIESKRANEHNIPIIIININNYYKGLITQLETTYQEKFANISNKKYYYIADTTDDAIEYIKRLGDENE